MKKRTSFSCTRGEKNQQRTQSNVNNFIMQLQRRGIPLKGPLAGQKGALKPVPRERGLYWAKKILCVGSGLYTNNQSEEYGGKRTR